MASQPNSQPEAVPESSKRGGTSSAKSPILGEVTDETNAEIIALTPWLQTATEFMVRDDGLMVYSNRQIFEERFRSLLEKLGHKDMVAKHFLRTIARPTRIYGSHPDRVSILYPLRIPSGSSPRAYPESNPDSISLKLEIGKFVEFRDPLFVNGLLDFLLIRIDGRRNWQ
ncbi:hypothetical protein McanMca71_003185 [Microsporum canis]|uniref:Uncharacterized protein n=1 Tax=Arthroderma otae (strain ATCC MYA-4605 / CBS 113480) TaxID=554155 RepID=C5FZU2_ARTOC|nr:uncharacterized protein MCYG_08214 [Microsporum canis CBS 113480]EEQ35395.1 predicted protein [Microsporum canis CBS 113480]